MGGFFSCLKGKKDLQTLRANSIGSPDFHALGEEPGINAAEDRGSVESKVDDSNSPSEAVEIIVDSNVQPGSPPKSPKPSEVIGSLPKTPTRVNSPVLQQADYDQQHNDAGTPNSQRANYHDGSNPGTPASQRATYHEGSNSGTPASQRATYHDGSNSGTPASQRATYHDGSVSGTPASQRRMSHEELNNSRSSISSAGPHSHFGHSRNKSGEGELVAKQPVVRSLFPG